ncbi:hypothetical protein [Phytoactinopolyspora mesophila]|uniref:Uncharacterized protein n=1 Tax=Phytoactinopolyspora mesophila TaxID=2650750 RepID=A0A7K3MAK9_9ACTN|nr:hypothetical protein [Phytoactinopolyspora mesophila]NDL60067.1 hypothetical protein [Phytoactinopolyspora mesophila]
MDRFRREFESFLDRPLGNVDAGRAIAAARRRRSRRVATVAGAAAVLVVGGVAVTAAVAGFGVDPSSGDPRPARSEEPLPAPTQTEQGASFSVTDWLPEQQLRGTPPEVGTLIYRTCVDGDCVVKLLTPDGAEYPLAEISADLAAKIEEYGLDGAAASHDGKKMGIRLDEGFEVFDIGHSSPLYMMPRGPAGSRWEVTAWGVGTSHICLAQTIGGEVMALSHNSVVHELEDDADLPPIATAGCGALAEPIDTSVAPENRQRITEPLDTTRVAVYELIDNAPPGTVLDFGDSDWGTAEVLRDRETLAGPRGVHEEVWHPGSHADDDPLARRGFKVFTPHGDNLRMTAVIAQGYHRGSEYVRFDLPESTPDETWEYLALTHDGVAVSRRSAVEDASDVFVLPADGGNLRLLHTLPFDAEVVMPGAVVAVGARGH